MISRRTLLVFGTALLLLPERGRASYTKPITIAQEPFQTIAVVHRDLFPGGRTVPSPHFLKALDYLGGVFDDPYVDVDEKRFLINGAVWLNEQARETYDKPYYLLDDAQRQHLLKEVSEMRWGDNWLWNLFSYLFEALLCDPVYGANTYEAGWHWLGHEPGYPRPKRPLALYAEESGG